MGKMAKPVLIGVAVGAGCCLLLLLLFAAILAAQDIPQGRLRRWLWRRRQQGLFRGFTAARIAKSRGILFGAICGLILYLLIMAAGFAVLRDIRGTYALVKLALMVVCASVGGILGVNFHRR